MAKHMQILEDSCERLWDMLEKLNKSNPDPAKDAEQYHRILSAIADSVGIKMAEEAEDEEGSYSQRRYGIRRGGYSGTYWDPMIYGNAYRGGNPYIVDGDWNMDGMSGARNQRRDSMGRYSRNDGGYNGHNAEKQETISSLYRMRDNASTEQERIKYQRIIEEMERL